MEQGLISPGNAGNLEHLLKSDDAKGLKELIHSWKTSAVKENCNKILISAESLVHRLAIEGNEQMLVDAANDLNIKKVHALGFFRDLVEHALSTFKHRAKTGKIPDFNDWISNVYETPDLIKKILHVSAKGQIMWTFKKFEKNSDVLLNAFYNDWLSIPPPLHTEKPAVNESLTLSEILLMNHIVKVYPKVSDFFVDAFKSLPSAQKGNDKLLEQRFKIIASQALAVHESLIQQFNQRFSSNESLQIGSFQETNLPANIEIVLSEHQLEVLAASILKVNTAAGKLTTWRRTIIKMLPGFLKNRLMSLIKG